VEEYEFLPYQYFLVFTRTHKGIAMVDWGNWGWLAPAAPWIGAAVALVSALLASATVWARWRPEPGDEAGGMPLSLRWIPALTLGIASAAVVWLMMPPGQPELQMALGAAAALA